MKSLKEKIEAAASASEKALAEKERLLTDLKVDPGTRNPKPESGNPSPETLVPKPESRNSKPETRVQKSESRQPIPAPRNPEP